MSAVETPSKTEAPKVAPKSEPTLTSRIGTALVELDQAMDNRKTAVAAVGFVRVQLGRLFSEKLASLAKSGTTGEDAQKKILTLIGPRLDENEKPYDWTTVNGWIVAAATEDSLPENLHKVFHVEGLRTIARVEKKAGKEEDGTKLMSDFASAVQKSGKTSARAIRTAYSEKYPSKERTPKSSAAVAEDLRKTFADVAKAHRKTLAKAGLSWTLIRPVAIMAATIGQESGDIEAVTIALNVLMDPKQDAPKSVKK